MNQQAYIDALIELHEPLERQGPGDKDFSVALMKEIQSHLPTNPKMLDLGAGSGVATLLLAQTLGTQLQAVDFSETFIGHLEKLMIANSFDGVKAYAQDFSQLPELDFESGSYDLFWSEGAAYNLGFENALQTWRPLLKSGGLAVISEMSWFVPNPNIEAQQFWQDAYPQMASEQGNIELAEQTGFECIATKRLPAKAWWDNYYNPLLQRMQYLRMTIGMNASEEMFDVLDDTDKEISLFDQYSDDYGYTFYILRAR